MNTPSPCTPPPAPTRKARSITPPKPSTPGSAPSNHASAAAPSPSAWKPAAAPSSTPGSSTPDHDPSPQPRHPRPLPQGLHPSGASDDLPDARLLLERVRDHTPKLRPLEPEDPQTVQLAGLVEARRDLVNRRTQVLNQLTSLRRAYYPQALELVGDLDTALAVDFLDRWPDLLTLKTAQPGVLKRCYYAHPLRRPELLEERLQLIRQAVALTLDDARVRVAVLQLRGLRDPLRALRRHVARFEQESKTAFAAHAEVARFRDLPGAGPALAPRLYVAFGTLRTLCPDPASLQKHAGVAPVRENAYSGAIRTPIPI